METALSTIKLLPFSKQQVSIFSDQLKDSLENGQIDPLELAVYFKAIEETIKQVKEVMSGLALNEAEKYGKSFQFKGAKIDIREVGTSYDYSKSGDIDWERLNSEINATKERQKEREALIKSLKEPMTAVYEETGETYTIYPPAKKSTTSIVISLI